MSITKASQFDFSKTTFSDVKKLNKAKMVYCNYNSGKILLQTPKMNVPFGLSRWHDSDANDTSGDSFKLPLSFYGESDNSEIKKFKENMEHFDNIIKHTIQKNSKEWLGKPNVSMEAIESAFYSPNVKLSMDKDGKEFPPRIEVKLDRQKENETFTGKFVSNKKSNQPILIFDENKQLINLNESNYDSVIPKGSHVICLIELVYVSITAKISCKWKLVQAKVFKNTSAITEYALLDDDSETEYRKPTELPDDLDSESVEEESASDPDPDPEQVEDEVVDQLTETLQETKIEPVVKKGGRPKKV